MKHRNTLAAVAVALALPAGHALELEAFDPDTKIRLDFTPKYSVAYWLQNPSAQDGHFPLRDLP
jgi:hypothetical protein